MKNNPPVPYSVRLPVELRETLKVKAKKNGRSMHAEILLRLENSLIETPKDQLLAEHDFNSPENREYLKEIMREVIKEDNK
jgi:predicted DNA-binding protein